MPGDAEHEVPGDRVRFGRDSYCRQHDEVVRGQDRGPAGVAVAGDRSVEGSGDVRRAQAVPRGPPAAEAVRRERRRHG